ncbi:MAG: DinB family protein [Nitrospinae bacterium]|nr:DinB family protein [Nitrospinota bacterium]
MANREFFIQRWEREYPAFVRVFKALPADRLGYRPHPRSRSAAELVWVLVYEEKVCSDLIDTGTIDWQETAPPQNLTEMIAAYEKHHAELATRLKQLDEAGWERKGRFIEGGHLVMEEPLREIFWVLLFDAVHHRGQLSTYIRPMGGRVPSIYGPSADDAGG